MMSKAWGATLLAGVALLSGCGSGASNGQAGANGLASNSVLPASANATLNAPATAAAGNDADYSVRLRLAAGGLAAGQPGLHSGSVFAFGIPRAEAEQAVTALLGQPTGRDSNGECGAGPMEFTSYGSLRLNFQEGRFVGWSLDGPARTPPIETEYGLGIGTQRSRIAEDEQPLRVEQSTLGHEFDAGGVQGLLNGPEPSATVTTLWAGTNCHFR